MEQKLYGGIELGGTKTICVIGDVGGIILAQTTIPTSNVDQTFAAIFEFFEQYPPVASLGVGSFGPLHLDPSSPDYGCIYNTPKQGWSNVNIKSLLEERLKLDVVIELDVNCAALGEHYYGVARHVHSFVYLTLGTGIGGSLIIDDKLVHGLLNLEMGHTRIPHEPFAGSFQGSCSFHGDCFEGIASGTAVEQRYGKKGEEITDIEIWNRQAGYVASAIGNLMLTIGPELIVIGGGLTGNSVLLDAARLAVQQNINGYMVFPDLENYIVKSSGNTNGVLGAIKLASRSN